MAKRSTIAALLGLLLVSCQPAIDHEAERLARIERIENGLLPTRIIEGEELATPTIQERMEHYGVPGVSVVVIEKGQVDWARGYGLAEVDSERPVTPETLFQAASMSKPVAAMAALALVDEGLLELDGNVNMKLEGWKIPENDLTAEQPVTLRGLLTHTAGLTVHGFPGYGPDETVPATTGVLEGKGNTPAVGIDMQPRTKWRYSGGGYTVMQKLVEDATNAPFEQAMARKVLEPLKMSRSTYQQPLPAELHDQAATGYRSDGEAVRGRFHTYPEMAAAGLWTTPTDLAKYLISIQEAKSAGSHPVLSDELIRQTLAPDLNDHGLGPGLSGDPLRFGHGGANAGFRCYMTAFVDGDQGAVIMTNSDRGSPLAREILLTIAAEYGWEGVEPVRKTLAKLSRDQLEDIAGRYRSGNREIEIEQQEGRLWGRASWNSQRLELLPESSKKLFTRESGLTLDVVRQDDGTVRSIRVRGLEFDKLE